jgi:hypothetical protein
MNYIFPFLVIQRGYIQLDLPATSQFLEFSIGFWLVMFGINLVLGVLKRIPFV